jgi:predicted DNA-binding protein
MAKHNISATIDGELLERLNQLAELTERNRSWLITKAIESYLEELEDLKTAKERVHDQRLTPAQLRKELSA